LSYDIIVSIICRMYVVVFCHLNAGMGQKEVPWHGRDQPSVGEDQPN
jgi:hypothetical protein